MVDLLYICIYLLYLLSLLDYNLRVLSRELFQHGFLGGGHAQVQLDRKVLAELAVSDPKGFAHIAKLAAQHL